MNYIKIAFLMILLMALFMFVGYLVGGQTGIIIAFLLASGLNFFSYWYSDKMVLKMYRAREVTESDCPKLYNAVKAVINKVNNYDITRDILKSTSNTHMPMPKVYLIPSKAPNAFATGRNAEHAAVAATEGIIGILNQDELTGVIGHEIAHIKHKDMLIGMVVATFVGAIGILASIARWGAIFGGFSRDDERGGIAGLLVAAIVAPLVAMIIQLAISRQREYRADAEGGKITGKYLALASALEKIHKAPVRLNLDNRPATAHLMIANPLSGKGLSSLFSTHPPVEKRIERLRKLAEESIYKGLA
ncbi:MAG: zinc metalloprotease HtpX [FCB group bacterium]|nr:zinc metalloprotease HtpX [FCB group bacterium]